jgi:putative chitinase
MGGPALITPARIKALCPEADMVILSLAAPAFEEHRAPAYVTTPLRIAHFMAQLAHESAHFKRLHENLNYSAKRIAVIWPRLAARAAELARNPEKLGNAAYGGRMGNGKEETGDGFRFRGRGFIQLTGRYNYRTRGADIGVDLIADPDLAARPDIAARLALSFWRANGCNALADQDDVAAVTRRVNGGLIGLEDRERLTARAKEIFTEPAQELIA